MVNFLATFKTTKSSILKAEMPTKNSQIWLHLKPKIGYFNGGNANQNGQIGYLGNPQICYFKGVNANRNSQIWLPLKPKSATLKAKIPTCTQINQNPGPYIY